MRFTSISKRFTFCVFQVVVFVFSHSLFATPKEKVSTEKYRLEMVGKVVNYIFADNGFGGLADTKNRAQLLRSIPLNQVATRELAEKAFDFNLGECTSSDWDALAQMMLGELKQNQNRMNDPIRHEELLKLEQILTHDAQDFGQTLETFEATSETAEPKRSQNDVVEGLITQIEELKIANSLQKHYDPQPMYIALGVMGVCFLVVLLLFFSVKQQNWAMKGLIGKLQYQIEVLHNRLFDMESRLMQTPYELKNWKLDNEELNSSQEISEKEADLQENKAA